LTTPAGPLHLRFRRFECKYLITPAQAVTIRRFIAPYVEPDPFAARSADGSYEISSLYLDSGDLRLHHETLEGLRDRYKLRVRAYTDRDEDPVFFELKRRHDRVITKERARVRRVDMAALVSGGRVDDTHMPRAERASLVAFRFRQDMMQARPRILVRYLREAYQGVFDASVRVTFDSGICAQPVDRPRRFFGAGGWERVTDRRLVLELKFNERCPNWMTEAIRLVGLQRISFSKYALSVQASALARTMQM
jgi:hypothetical protein